MKLYIDVDGVILLPGSGGPILGSRVKDDVDKFIPWAVSYFECYWLTAWAANGITTQMEKLLFPHLPPEAANIQAVAYGDNKTDAITDGDFIWIDDNLLRNEQKYLAENNWLNNFILVDTFSESIKPVMRRIKQIARI